MPLVKSHSNYLLKSRHQLINDGTVFERDITTIGAVNSFAPGQLPIYRTGNFVITVRGDKTTGYQYNTKKWEQSISGDNWTLDAVAGMISGDEKEDDTKIVLKNDYYDFRDFSYYGSLLEMFRASILDAMKRFPGELYFVSSEMADSKVYYKKVSTEAGERIEEYIRLGGENGNKFYISNPFHINVHTEKMPLDADNTLLFFANDGWKEYDVIPSGSSVGYPITACTFSANNLCDESEYSKVYGTKGKIGDLIATTTIKYKVGSSTKTLKIYAYLGNNREVIYLHDAEQNGFHIRPREKKYLTKFYNECNDFQRLIFNNKTTPKYKATFSVIRENDYGYYRTFEDFVFPMADGGDYNIGADSQYVDRLIEIGTFYDERFTDVLYRAMTHESIKNFDWSGDAEDNIEGGEKIQKALRIFAREFDEIKKYIDAIKDNYRITYDERNNLPDYFLADVCVDDGWDIKSVMPYDLKFYNGEREVASATTRQLMNNTYTHEYSQSSKNTVKPYTKDNIKDGTADGYFLDCEGDGECYIEGVSNIPFSGGKITFDRGYETGFSGCINTWYAGRIKAANSSAYTTAFPSGRIENRIKPFSDEKEYTYSELQNEFLRRLKINSRALWRHKGTIEGLEMILGMFGLKSKRWTKRTERCLNSECYVSGESEIPKSGGTFEFTGGHNSIFSKDVLEYDYDIVEYTQFATRIEDPWDESHQMYKYDWFNSTKTINYDYRSISNNSSLSNVYISYQGLPVSYREPYSGETTTNVRYLYPNFNKNEQIDGNPYYQMDGGWLSKTLASVNGTPYQNFQFDVDNNIVHTKFIDSENLGEKDGFVNDNHRLYKETIRSIKRVDNLSDLFSQPQSQLTDGVIFYVAYVPTDIAIIEGDIFTVSVDNNNNNSRYVSFTKSGGLVKVGTLYFDGSIKIYNANGDEYVYNIDDKEDGFVINAYFKKVGSKYTFMCENADATMYKVSNYQIITGATDDTYSNYYVLDDAIFSTSISTSESSFGWRRLKYTDAEYKKVNTIANYYEGNNGHNGNMNYDNGHEYFTYFKRIFKHAFDNDLFDDRCFNSEVEDTYDIYNVGFSGLVNPDESVKEYYNYLSEDSKVHYFGNYKKAKWCVGNVCQNDYGELFASTTEAVRYKERHKLSATVTSEIDSINIYGNEGKYKYKCVGSGDCTPSGTEICDGWECFYGKSPSYYSIESGDNRCIYYDEIQPHASKDDVTNQIVNNKIIKIIFNMKNKFDSKEGQIELKYIDDIIMNYLTQMIPSTAIAEVEYRFRDYDYSEC